jgi:hypothetical protein
VLGFHVRLLIRASHDVKELFQAVLSALMEEYFA